MDPHFNRFVCVARAHTTSCELLRSYHIKTLGQQNYKCTIWEAARATTAAPAFFEPVTLAHDKVTFVDGGIRENNPINQVITEAERLWPGRPIGCIVSIGTGWKLIKPLSDQKSKLHNILKTLSQITTDAVETARAFAESKEGKMLLRAGKYHRFSVEQGIDGVHLEAWEKGPWMESMAQAYLRDKSDELLACAKNLVEPLAVER
jgi:predicted acylesterase/phospholipase RssA